MKKVSVIIVNFNGAHHLKNVFYSLNNVNYPQDKLEIIVFDNGSSDNSLDVIKNNCPKAVVLKCDHNTGFAKPHRIAAQVASGDVLAFLNNDMKVDVDWIKKGVSQFSRAEDIVCVASKIMDWNGENIDFCGGTVQYFGFADQLHETSLNNGDEILFPCGGAMFIQKDIFIKAGCFDDEYFAIFEDVDLGWRLWVMGYRVVMATDSIVYHRGHGTLDTQKETKKRYLMHRNAMLTIIKNYNDTNLNKILPLSFVFAVKRALLFMGVDKKKFYFWEDGDYGQSKEPDNYEEGCIHLAALDDVISDFKRVSEKREQVQSLRRREDSEIFVHFKDPFRNIMGYHEYLWDEVSLFGHFALDQIFNCEKDYAERQDEAKSHALGILDEMIAECRNGMNGCGKENINVMIDKPRENLYGKILINFKSEGFVGIVKKIFARMIARRVS